MEDISKLKFSFYRFVSEEGQAKAVEVVEARLRVLGVPSENIKNFPVSNHRVAAKRAGRQAVRLPRVFIGDTPKPPHNKRMTGGLAWFEGWMDAYEAEAELLKRKDPSEIRADAEPPTPLTEAPEHPSLFKGVFDPNPCPHCKTKDGQIEGLKAKCGSHKNEIQKAQSRIHDLKSKSSASCRVTDDKLLEHDAQLQVAVGALAGVSREMVVELEAIREDMVLKPYTKLDVQGAIEDCTELLPLLSSVNREKIKAVRGLLWHLVSL